MTRFKIHPTLKQIQAWKKGTDTCPIAQELKKRGYEKPSVTEEHCIAYSTHGRTTFKMTKAMIRFIHSVDSNTIKTKPRTLEMVEVEN